MTDAAELTIPMPRWAVPLQATHMPDGRPVRYYGAWGGRGSGKSHEVAGRMVEEMIADPDCSIVCIREIQKSLNLSAKKLIETKIEDYGVGHLFDVRATEIRRRDGKGLCIFQGMQDHTADSVKSLEGFDIAWVEEAQSLSQHSLDLLRPTIRKEGSRLFFSWNPRRKTDPIEKLLRPDGKATRPDAIVVKANYTDNPFLPDTLRREAENDQEMAPDSFAHIWLGDFVTAVAGAYFAKDLAQARLDGRIGFVPRDPIMEVRAYWDIGGTSQASDATAIWLVQFVGREVRFLDYYEAIGQPMEAHVNWLRSRGYPVGTCVLPHDGVKHDSVYAVTPESALRDAGFAVVIVQNQGRGAAMKRVEALRRLFPACRFNAEACEAGIDALGWYHEKRSEDRNIGFGPEHDWSSHGADAAGLVAVAYAAQGAGGAPTKRATFKRRAVV